jgi:hypothetical protein
LAMTTRILDIRALLNAFSQHEGHEGHEDHDDLREIIKTS